MTNNPLDVFEHVNFHNDKKETTTKKDKRLNVKVPITSIPLFRNIQEHMESDSGKSLNNSEVLNDLMNFYFFTIIQNNLTENEAKKIISNNKQQKKLNAIDENTLINTHILLAILNNIGLQVPNKNHPNGTVDYLEELYRDNNSTKLYNHVKEQVHNEIHRKKLERDSYNY